MSDNISNNNQSEDRASATTYKNVALHECTYARLTAFKNQNPLVDKSFDAAINEVLDAIDFPQADEIENMYLPNIKFSSDDTAQVND
jgi:hypothetical protein